jgi:hypothetical protein
MLVVSCATGPGRFIPHPPPFDRGGRLALAFSVPRTPVSRLVAALLALFWCASVGARPMLSACPMGAQHAAAGATHGGGAHGPHGAQHDAQHDALHAAHASHAANASLAEQDAPEPSEGPATGGHPCDCLSQCCAATVLVPAPDSSRLLTAERFARAETPHWSDTFVPGWTDFVLPFATAPPASVLG